MAPMLRRTWLFYPTEFGWVGKKIATKDQIRTKLRELKQ